MRRTLVAGLALLVVFSFSSIPAFAGTVTVFAGDKVGFDLAVAGLDGVSVQTLGFDERDIPAGATRLMEPEFYNSTYRRVGAPFFTAAPNGFLLLADLTGPPWGIPPVSLDNVFAVAESGLASSSVTISFARPVTAIGGVFMNTSTGWVTTGWALAGTNYFMPGYFPAAPGPNSEAFFGFVSTDPFTEVVLHLNSAHASNNAVFLDDLVYAAVVPVPAPFGLAVLGFGLLLIRRRLRR